MDYYGNEDVKWVNELDLDELRPGHYDFNSTTRLVSLGKTLAPSTCDEFPLAIVSNSMYMSDLLRRRIDPLNIHNIIACTFSNIEHRLKGFNFVIDILVDNY